MSDTEPKKRGRKPGTKVERNKFQLAGQAVTRLKKLESKRQDGYRKVDEHLEVARKVILHSCPEEVQTMLINAGDATVEEFAALRDFVPPKKRGPKAHDEAAE